MAKVKLKKAPVPVPDASAPRARFDDFATAIWGLTRGASRPGRLLLGTTTRGLDRVVTRAPALAQPLGLFVLRYQVYLLSSGDAYARRMLASSAISLSRQIKRLGGPGTKEALGEIDDVLQRIRLRPRGGLNIPQIRPTLFERLRSLGPQVDGARKLFENAIAAGDPVTLQARAEDLKRAIQSGLTTEPKGLTGTAAHSLTKQIDSLVRRLTAVVDTAEAADALKRFADLIEVLDPSTPARSAFRRVVQMADTDADEWLKVGQALVRATKGGDDNVVQAMIWRVKGAIAEVVARGMVEYREQLQEAIGAAHRFAARSKGKWEVRIVRTEVRMLTRDGKRMALSYDDAVFLVSTSGDPRQAATVFAAQIKSGDYSSGQVVEQINNDMARELLGRVQIDGSPFDLVVSPMPIKRLFVGTAVPPKELADQLGTQIGFLPLPVGGDDLDELAAAGLAAVGKL